MHNFNLAPHCIPNLSHSQELKEASRASGSQPHMSVFSMQTLKSALPNYVSQSYPVQNNAYSGNPLNKYAVSASPSKSHFKIKATRAIHKQSPAGITTQTIQPERDYASKTELAKSRNEKIAKRDVYLGTVETVEAVSEELISMELNAPTDTSTPLQGVSFGKTSVNFSQSSLPPVTIVNPQQKAQTEAESINLLLTPSKHKTARARAQAKYEPYSTGKAAKTRNKAIQLEKYDLYQVDFRSGNQKIARQKGEEATERKR